MWNSNSEWRKRKQLKVAVMVGEKDLEERRLALPGGIK